MQFDKSMFLLALNTDGVSQLVHGCLSWQRKGRLPLFEVLMISCDIIIDKPVSTIIISLYCYHYYNNDTIDGDNHVDAPVSTIIISIVCIVIIIIMLIYFLSEIVNSEAFRAHRLLISNDTIDGQSC